MHPNLNSFPINTFRWFRESRPIVAQGLIPVSWLVVNGERDAPKKKPSGSISA